MKIIILLLIFGLCSCSIVSDRKDKTQKEIKDTIPFISMSEYPDSIFGVYASINGNHKGVFMLDSGTSDSLIVMDSAFFFNYIDTNNLKKGYSDKEPFWRVNYYGNISIFIEKDTFFIDNAHILVLNNKDLFYPSNYYLPVDGIIGSSVFKDKIIIVDFAKKKFAYMDEFIPDSSFICIPLEAPLSEDRCEKLVTIDGFRDKRNKNVSVKLLFDTGNMGDIVIKYSLAKKLQKSESAIERGRNIYWQADTLYASGYIIKDVILKHKKKGEFDQVEFLSFADGLLGIPFLQKYLTVIDYKHNMLYLKPIENTNNDFILKNE